MLQSNLFLIIFLPTPFKTLKDLILLFLQQLLFLFLFIYFINQVITYHSTLNPISIDYKNFIVKPFNITSFLIIVNFLFSFFNSLVNEQYSIPFMDLITVKYIDKVNQVILLSFMGVFIIMYFNVKFIIDLKLDYQLILINFILTFFPSIIFLSQLFFDFHNELNIQ